MIEKADGWRVVWGGGEGGRSSGVVRQRWWRVGTAAASTQASLHSFRSAEKVKMLLSNGGKIKKCLNDIYVNMSRPHRDN